MGERGSGKSHCRILGREKEKTEEYGNIKQRNIEALVENFNGVIFNFKVLREVSK